MTRRFFSASRVFTVFALSAVAAIGYSRLMRDAAIPREFQHVPKESEAIYLIGDFESLWHAIDAQFGAVMRDQQRKGPLAQAVNEIQKELNRKGIPIESLGELKAHGINISRGALVALGREASNSSPAILALLHVDSFDSFKRFFARLAAVKEGATFDLGDRTVTVYGKNDLYLAQRDDEDVIIISNSINFLKKSIERSTGNLSYWQADDGFYDAVRQRARSGQLRGRDLFFFVRSPVLGQITRSTGVIGFSDEGVQIDIEAEVRAGGARAVDDLFKPSKIQTSWQRRLPADTTFVFAFQHPMVSRYLPVISSAFDLEEAAANTYAKVLGRFARDAQFQQFVVTAPRYHDGLPDLVFGLWADSRTLDRLAGDVQYSLREQRDRRVLQAAMESFCSSRELEDCNPTAAQLFKEGLLAPEPEALFQRFAIVKGQVQPLAQDENTQTIRLGSRVQYLAPGLTKNDIRYRPELSKTTNAMRQNDRYRLAAMSDQGGLWVATSRDDLNNLMASAAEQLKPLLIETALFRVSARPSTPLSRAWAFLNVDRLISIGLASGEKEIQRVARTSLLDLRNHPALTLDLTPSNDGRYLRLRGRVVRWSAVSGQ